MSSPLQLRFLTSADDVSRLPDTPAELAFIGRSNVGKSSLVNALGNRKDLSRVAKAPGRTQLLNCFAVDGLGTPLAVVSPATRPFLISAAAVLAQLALAVCIVPRLRIASAPLFAVAVCAAIAALGPIYPPHALVVWQARFGHQADIAGALHAAWGITSVDALGGTWAVITAWRRGRAGSAPCRRTASTSVM